MGPSPRGWLVHRRLVRARHLRKTTRLPITEVAGAAGVRRPARAARAPSEHHGPDTEHLPPRVLPPADPARRDRVPPAAAGGTGGDSSGHGPRCGTRSSP
ncbi:hypothetical protein [Amycolatopsis heterodermiae]|uniref:hypothetical protein n=1 Tax=Amycolatopsis heterodermiae TaxID=3110235 RepID=UPI00396A8F17